MRSVDDRDQPIELHPLDRRLMKRPMYMPMKLTEPQRRRNDRMLRDGTIFAAFPLVFLFFIFYFSPRFSSIPCMGSIASFVLLIVVIRRSIRRYERVDAIHWITAYLHCAACGHSLRGLRGEHNVCTVCPECGAAWQIPQFEYPPPEGDSMGV